MAECFKVCVYLFLTVFIVKAYVLDDNNGVGRRFDGIGGISGGGATSKLLVNYPDKERNEILDYLFKPNFGASLQILKVEIGGDSDSTDGTESSHMHESWDENYERGYEWWLMVEAKKRNPDILLYGLPWAFPGWVGNGSGSPYSAPNITANYILRWIQGAKTHYSLDINYIGIWNERQYDITYVKVLRSTLDANGLNSIRIVAADGHWGITNDIYKDPAFAKVVDYIGVHYPGTKSTDLAVKLGKPLWASEDYSTYNDDVGAGCWARILNQNYVNGYMTSTISWNLIASYYQNLPFGRDGLMTAQEPWSAFYVVENPIWITAHTTQFTKIGWMYLKHGAGVDHLDKGGSYVSLVDANKNQMTIVIETMSHDHSLCIRPSLPAYNVSSQTASFSLKGSLVNIKELNVWYSKLNFNGKPSNMLLRKPTIPVLNGTFSVELGVDEIYTLTTVDTGFKGLYGPPPPSKPFPLPYKDNFEGYPIFSEAPDFGPQVGVWEVRKSNDASHGNVNRQLVLNQPCDWCKNTVPVNIGGNHNWSDVFVQADVMIPSINGSDAVFIASRIKGGGCGSDRTKGIYFFLNITAKEYVLSLDPLLKTVFTRGPVADAKFDRWYTLTLITRGTNAIGYLDQKKIFTTSVGKTNNGFVGYGTNRFGLADFDNFAIEDTHFIPKFP